MDVSREPVKFCYHEHSLRSFRMCEGSGKLGPVASLASLDLLITRDDLVLALPSVIGDTGLLSFQAETALTLPSRRNAKVWHELTHLCCSVLGVLEDVVPCFYLY